LKIFGTLLAASVLAAQCRTSSAYRVDDPAVLLSDVSPRLAQLEAGYADLGLQGRVPLGGPGARDTRIAFKLRGEPADPARLAGRALFAGLSAHSDDDDDDDDMRHGHVLGYQASLHTVIALLGSFVGLAAGLGLAVCMKQWLADLREGRRIRFLADPPVWQKLLPVGACAPSANERCLICLNDLEEIEEPVRIRQPNGKFIDKVYDYDCIIADMRHRTTSAQPWRDPSNQQPFGLGDIHRDVKAHASNVQAVDSVILADIELNARRTKPDTEV